MPAKYYAFLDVVLDVFYSIILYNAFIAFPGFKWEALLMAFAIFVMLNYWWEARSFYEMPKHYLVDLYLTTIVMFIFAQWPDYFTNAKGFLTVLILFLLFDGIYSILLVFIHKEQKDEKTLWHYAAFEFFLAVIYAAIYLFISKVSLPLAIVLIIFPYLIFYVI
jgi:hypothetical protein